MERENRARFRAQTFDACVIEEARMVGEQAMQATELRHYWNIWTIEFDDAGRCETFVEYFMQRKKPAA